VLLAHPACDPTRMRACCWNGARLSLSHTYIWPPAFLFLPVFSLAISLFVWRHRRTAHPHTHTHPKHARAPTHLLNKTESVIVFTHTYTHTHIRRCPGPGSRPLQTDEFTNCLK
jgi:hypothetical protein